MYPYNVRREGGREGRSEAGTRRKRRSGTVQRKVRGFRGNERRRESVRFFRLIIALGSFASNWWIKKIGEGREESLRPSIARYSYIGCLIVIVNCEIGYCTRSLQTEKSVPVDLAL